MSALRKLPAIFVITSLFSTANLMAADDGGWTDLNSPSPYKVDKLIIQDDRTLEDEPPPPVKPRPQPQKPKPRPAPKDGVCTANAPISIKDQSSGSTLDMLYFTPSPSGKSYRYTIAAPGLGESGFTARIVPKPDYVSRRVGRVEVSGSQLTYTTPKPEDTFEGVLEIRSADRAVCRSLPIRIEDGGCLIAGTQVSMSDGSSKNIENVKPGDLVIAHDLENNRLSDAVVEKLLVHDEITFILHELVPGNGVPLFVTGNHPILVKGHGWQQVDNIKPGDIIFHRDSTSGSLVETTVASIIRDRSEQGTVYNLKTSRGNYIANDILVHNKCLAKGTLVETPSGKRPIESLLPGDRVMGSVDGEIVPVRVVNTYTKETILPTIPGKRLSDGVVATANHQVVSSGIVTRVGEMQLPDVSITGTVYDIRTDSGNYVSGRYIMVTGD